MEQSAPTSQKAAERPKWKLVAVVAGIVLAVALYLLGFANGRSQVAELRTELSSAKEKLAATEEQRDVALARALLYRCATELEARNFGSAQEKIAAAGEVLASMAPGGGSRGDRIRDLHKQLQTLRIDVSTNVETQRNAVLGLAKKLDALQPP